MVVATHTVIKPQRLAATYVALVERQLVIPQLFARRGIEEFKGTEGDTVSIKVPGRLPARRYGFRNDRTNPIKLDVYTETKQSVSFGDLIYSGSPITDEQKDFDLVSAESLLPIQARAVAEEINAECVDALLGASFPVSIGGAGFDMVKALIEAKRVMDKLRLPGNQRFLLLGSDFEAVLLGNKDLTSANQVGDSLAETAFAQAIIGKRFNFNFVSAGNDLPGNTAIAMIPNAAALLTGAPSIPDGVSKGATASSNGYALRWMQDYDFMYRYDRSSVDTYVGTQVIKDNLVRFDTTTKSDDTTHTGAVVDTTAKFLRAIKLTLAGTSAGATAGSALDLDTESTTGAGDGLKTANIWQGA